MAAVKALSSSYRQFAGGRKDDFAAGYISPLSYYSNTLGIASPVASNNRLAVSSSTKAVGDEDRAGSLSASPKSSKQYKLRSSLRNIDTKMSSRTMTTTIPATSSRSDSRQSNLHKRGSSSSSLPGSPAAIAAAHAQFTTQVPTYEEPFPDISTTPITSTPKIKPYLRKISTGKEDLDQGRLDLSKSVSENSALAGLGIQDFGARSVSDGLPTGRSIAHTRNTSVGSQISNSSGTFRTNQLFVHPLRPTPTRPYTPPTDASSMNDEEAHESSDVVTDDDVQPSQGLRGGRSMSLSTPQIQASTPLSQSHTAADLGYVPKLTNASQTNLSVRSGRSMKSSKSKLSRPRADTNRSVELFPSPSSRTSLDRTISFVSRWSDPDPQTRDERIRAARRKFEEKEASKDRKLENQAFKRRESELAKSAKKQERQRRKSEASDKPRIPKSKSNRGAETKSNELQARRYDESKITALPTHGLEPGKSEGPARTPDSSSASQSGWSRFSAWFQTRMLSCGGKGS